MKENKLVLIIDKSEAYVNFQKERFLTDWKIEKNQIEQVENLKSSNTITLFGDTLTSILHIETDETLKQTLKDLETFDKKSIMTTFENGLIITCIMPRTKTRKLEKIFKDFGATVKIPPGKKEDSLSKKLVNELNLLPEVKSFILSYVGDDYSTLIPLVDSLSTIPPKLHKKVTIEDIYIRLPQPPGELPPWEIENYLYKGDITKVIDIFRRTHHHKHLLVPLTMLKNKFQLMYRIAALKAIDNRLTDNEIAESLGVAKNYPFTLAKNNAVKYGYKKCEKAVSILYKTEANIKGGSAADSVVLMEKALVELNLLLN